MRRSIRKVATIAMTAALLTGLAGVYWRLRQTVATDTREAPRSSRVADTFSTDLVIPVLGARVVRDTFVVHVSAAGHAQAVRAVTVFAAVGGTVVDLPAREGAPVRAGQVLVRIDTVETALAVRQAEANLLKARAKFAELTLFDREAPDSVRVARRSMARVQSGLVDAEVAWHRARLDLERATLRAPFDGRVASLAVVQGQRVSPGDSVCAVVDLSRVDVDVQALEHELVHLERGRDARVFFAALPGASFLGRVVTVNPVVDRATGTARLRVTLENPDGRIRPGMYARIRIAARLYPDRVLVPRNAILERDRRKLVFVFQPDGGQGETGLAKWTYVTTGLENEEYVEIVPGTGTSMLGPGEIVLVEGHAWLMHDVKVRLMAPP